MPWILRSSLFAVLCTVWSGWVASDASCATLSPQKGRPVATREARESIAWLREHAFPVRNVDPADHDFSDLDPLVDLLGDARIVFLGEPSHGDGTTFLAKARLVAFLHQRMGFDVLAFESGLFDCQALNAWLRKDVPTAVAAAQGLYGVWALSGPFQSTLEYVRASANGPRPIEIVGFDCVFSSMRGRVEYPDALLEFLRASGADVLTDTLEQRFRAAFAAQSSIRPQSDAIRDELLSVIDRVREAVVMGDGRLRRAHSTREIAFFDRTLENLYALTEMLSMPKAHNVRENARDAAMARNLLWLADEVYSERKLIGWAAQSHFLYDCAALEPPRKMRDYFDGMRSMGEIVHDSLGDQVFSLAFTAGSGDFGIAFREVEPLGPVPEGSLESWFLAMDSGPAILGMRALDAGTAQWLTRPLLARPVAQQFCRARWSEQFDALFYLPHLEPSAAISDHDDRLVRESLRPYQRDER